jgi:hypothetical protein
MLTNTTLSGRHSESSGLQEDVLQLSIQASDIDEFYQLLRERRAERQSQLLEAFQDAASEVTGHPSHIADDAV